MLIGFSNSLYIEDLEKEDSKQMQQIWQCGSFLQMESSRCEHFQVVCFFLSIPAQIIQLAGYAADS